MRDALRRLVNRISLSDPEFRFLFDRHPPEDEVISLDCETTGLDPWVDDIIAVAAVPVRGNRIVLSERYEAVLRPTARRLSPTSIKIHRLRATDLREGRTMEEVLPELLRFIGPRPILGYYIDFDIGMLDKYALQRIGARLPNRRIEVSSLYYDVKYRGAPEGTLYDLRFATILADLGIPPLEQHDALNDALMAAMMYLQLRDLKARGVRLARGGRSRRAPGSPIGA